jgi:hypothetical protein
VPEKSKTHQHGDNKPANIGGLVSILQIGHKRAITWLLNSIHLHELRRQLVPDARPFGKRDAPVFARKPSLLQLALQCHFEHLHRCKFDERSSLYLS